MDGLRPPLIEAGSASAKFRLAPRNNFPQVRSSHFWLPSVSVKRQRWKSRRPRRNPVGAARTLAARTPQRSCKSWQQKENPRNAQDRQSPVATPEVSTLKCVSWDQNLKLLPGSPSVAWISPVFSSTQRNVFCLHLHIL